MRHLIPVTAEPGSMQGMSHVSIGDDYASFQYPTHKLVEDWDNPFPVAVMVQPVIMRGGSMGVLVGERRIAPFIGGLALPGGFMRKGETPEQAALRELGEESGYDASIMGDPRLCQILGALPTPNGRLLIFVQNAQRMTLADLEDVIGNSSKADGEMTNWQVYLGQPPMCFDLHQRVADAWLAHHHARTTPDQNGRMPL